VYVGEKSLRFLFCTPEKWGYGTPTPKSEGYVYPPYPESYSYGTTQLGSATVESEASGTVEAVYGIDHAGQRLNLVS